MNTISDTSGIKALGSGITEYVSNYDSSLLESINNQWMCDYEVKLICDEFTALCPKTRQPDFAKIEIIYIPDKKLIESKSLKLYLFSYRNTGIFHEDVANRIAADIFNCIKPKIITVKALFYPRGGISIHPTVTMKADGYDR